MRNLYFIIREELASLVWMSLSTFHSKFYWNFISCELNCVFLIKYLDKVNRNQFNFQSIFILTFEANLGTV
jgi:hypothetical protein